MHLHNTQWFNEENCGENEHGWFSVQWRSPDPNIFPPTDTQSHYDIIIVLTCDL